MWLVVQHVRWSREIATWWWWCIRISEREKSQSTLPVHVCQKTLHYFVVRASCRFMWGVQPGGCRQICLCDYWLRVCEGWWYHQICTTVASFYTRPISLPLQTTAETSSSSEAAGYECFVFGVIAAWFFPNLYGFFPSQRVFPTLWFFLGEVWAHFSKM